MIGNTQGGFGFLWLSLVTIIIVGVSGVLAVTASTPRVGGWFTARLWPGRAYSGWTQASSIEGVTPFSSGCAANLAECWPCNAPPTHGEAGYGGTSIFSGIAPRQTQDQPVASHS